MSVQQKKRKRSRAKDWPPTSAQRKTLLPYTKRFKLPLLGEAPFKAVWMKILSLALEDCKNECKTRCRKIKYFQEVHHELRKATLELTQIYRFCPIQISSRHSREQIHIRGETCLRPRIAKRSKITVCVNTDNYHSGVRSRPFRLVWTNDDTPIERLVWAYPVRNYSGQTVYRQLQVCGLTKAIFRHKQKSTWESFICDYLHGKADRDIVGDKRYNSYTYNKIEPHVMKRMIQLAPKSLDILTSKDRIYEIIDQNPPPEQSTSSSGDEGDANKTCRDKIFPYMLY